VGKTLKLAKLRPRDYLAAFIGLTLVFYAVFFAFVETGQLALHFRPHFAREFDSETWRMSGLLTNGNRGVYIPTYGKRYEMVDGLLASKRLYGMDAEKVKVLLGDPDAGVIDKQHLLASPDPYGGYKLSPAKEILQSTNNLAIWNYYLAPQYKYPARSIWLPFILDNSEEWILVLEMRDGKVAKTAVSH
jgi:hypothetical protein